MLTGDDGAAGGAAVAGAACAVLACSAGGALHAETRAAVAASVDRTRSLDLVIDGLRECRTVKENADEKYHR
jgi:hypothetical protein